MKKSLKILLIIILMYITFLLGKGVEANSIEKISMDIFVSDNGDADITETWKCNTSQGTEVYHPYYNLGKSKIENLRVTEGNIEYSTLSSWNTSGSLSGKAYKCGINKISNGVELCWGISKYGSHTYTVKYRITNFVSELNDSQMIYWTLIPHNFSNSIGDMQIKIYSDFKIADNIDVWGYGNYGGRAYVDNGIIEMKSSGTLSSDEYMTILVKFPKGTYSTTNKLNHDFNYYYEMAEEGAQKYVKNEGESVSIVKKIFLGIAVVISILFPLSFVILIVLAIMGSIIEARNQYDFGKIGNKIQSNVEYFRDIPCKKDIFRAYYISDLYGLSKNKTDILGAVILKWVKDDFIKIERNEKSVTLDLNNTDVSKIVNEHEKELFNMLYSASKDGILESKEFENWCKKKYTRILNWFDNIMTREEKKLMEEKLIVIKKRKVLKIYNVETKVINERLKEEALKLAGLKRYLKDYTMIKERESVEVNLFEEYLIYAQLFGIAKKVAKEFKNIYPEIIEESKFVSYENINYINIYAARAISTATYARQSAQSGSSYSSGGGGFSSGGGGGGSFGGGGGGGGFR